MSSSKKESYWIPLADLMTVLMVIFLFMAISYMALQEKQTKGATKQLKQYLQLTKSLHDTLYKVFHNDFKKWDLKLDSTDLSIKFTNPQVLFKSGSADITPYFQSILVDFLPKYLSVVMDKKYRTIISEIRIEGHTDTIPIIHLTGDKYINNMELSQDRARNVLAFLRTQPCFTDLTPSQKIRLQYLLTANGLSYGRTVDRNYQPSFISHENINNSKSRRVEFRIITATDSIINNLLQVYHIK
ncbi:MAG: OmpA family protein [Phycisphaerales bacterium]|nr:OmpA family protein [Phycisphaerales bacterium]